MFDWLRKKLIAIEKWYYVRFEGAATDKEIEEYFDQEERERIDWEQEQERLELEKIDRYIAEEEARERAIDEEVERREKEIYERFWEN